MLRRALPLLTTLAIAGCPWFNESKTVRQYPVVTVSGKNFDAHKVLMLGEAIRGWNAAIGVDHFSYAPDGGEIQVTYTNDPPPAASGSLPVAGWLNWFDRDTKRINIRPAARGSVQRIMCYQGLGRTMGLKDAETIDSIMYPDPTAGVWGPTALDAKWARSNLGIE